MKPAQEEKKGPNCRGRLILYGMVMQEKYVANICAVKVDMITKLLLSMADEERSNRT